MNNLKLPNPKMMDVAVPANMHVGLRQEEIARKGWALSAAEAMVLRGRTDVAIVDLREKSERERHGMIPGSLHAPYPDLRRASAPAACCTNWRHRPASESSSTVRLANARPWLYRRRKTRVSQPRVTSRAGSTPGKKPTDRWRGNPRFRSHNAKAAGKNPAASVLGAHCGEAKFSGRLRNWNVS